jgi:CHAT domain-containing protein
VVPDGPLESLPLQVLVTEAPGAELEGPEELRGVAWLAKRPYALNVLPAVGALRALRELAPNTPLGDGFVGFGDPLIGDAPAAVCPEPASEELAVAELAAEEESQSRRGPEVGPADLFHGGGWRDGMPVADVEAVRRLPRLPDSRCELQALARSLGAGVDALHLGATATEAAVKDLSTAGELRKAGVLAFASHGLVAGELDGLAEPALVLTPPAAGSAEDDGLLTAGEVAQLDLNAEWVLLSACNTAAADGTPGAEGLSGLARAFFYAGARALLVSHWSVYSPAAVALTTGTLERLRQEPGLGRAEALRRTMVELIERGPDPRPAYWAPFVVVGEGGAS